jgi:hypothetical protein
MATADYYNRWLTTNLEKFSLPVTTAQGLRSGRRTDLTTAGVQEEIILKLGRWKSKEGSRRYYQADPESLRALAAGSAPPQQRAAPAAPSSSEEHVDALSDDESSDEEDGSAPRYDAETSLKATKVAGAATVVELP